MQIYTDIQQMEPEKQMYGQIAKVSKVRVEYEYQGERCAIIPFSYGDLVVLVEITDEKEITKLLLEKYIKDKVLEELSYSEEIRKLSIHFKTELKKFRILVVKYSNSEEKEFSRHSLSNITFGVVNYNDVDIHLISSTNDVRTKDGYCLSEIVEIPEEGIRQAFLILEWFGGGSYEDLPVLALEKEVKNSKLAQLSRWTDFLKYIMFSKIDDRYFSLMVKRLNQFRDETYFDPIKSIEKITLGILLSKLAKFSKPHFPNSFEIFNNFNEPNNLG